MTIRYVLPALILGFAACETTPPAPVAMEQTAFDEAYALAEANLSPVSADQALSDLLTNQVLSSVQRAEILYLRAEKRRLGKLNLPGAISDYQQFLSLLPEDERAAMVEAHLSSMRIDIRAAEARQSRLQSIEAWFDDKVLLGGLPEAAARYRESQLTPTERQIYTLREAGYICATGLGEPVHNFGDVPAYAQDLTWCPATEAVS